VFNSGTPKGLKASTPKGGHWLPSSTFTASLLWKKAQKNLKKKKISETINKIIPQRKPNSTIEVCCPINLASRITSRHHWNETAINITSLTRKRFISEK
jgi:hypothetical protein